MHPGRRRRRARRLPRPPRGRLRPRSEARLDPLIQVAVVEGESGLAVRHVNQSFVHGEGPNGGREVAAVAAVIDERPIDGDLAEEIIDIDTPGRVLGLTTTTLLSDEMPPPMPSSWRPCGSGLPRAARKSASHSARSAGRSRRWKKRPLLVPPRRKTAGSAIWLTATLLSLGGSCAPPRRGRQSGRRPRPASPRWSPCRCGSRGRRSRPPRRGRGSSPRRC